MLYGFVKIMMTAAIRLFYRRIHVRGLKNIPAKGATIIIANHASSLMDAAVMGILSKRPIYFFARGDVFAKPWARAILKKLHMMPVYHHEEGRRTINQNEDSFSRAKQILQKGGLILYFPEGSSHTDRKLNPFRKGVFRLAFQTLEQPGFKGDILMVPVGLNYTHVTASQAEIMVEVGDPISINQFMEHYKKNPANAIRVCSQHCYGQLKQLVLHVDDDNKQQLADRLLTIQRNELLSEKNNHSSIPLFTLEKALCDKMNVHSAEKINSLEIITTNYCTELNHFRLPDKAVAKNLPAIAFRKIAMILLSPFFLIGYLLNMPPILFAKFVADKKVYREDFYTWIRVAASAILYIFWIIILVIVTLIAGGWIWVFPVLITTFLTGIIMRKWLLWLNDLKAQRHFNFLLNTYPGRIEVLQESRKQILQDIGKL